MPFRSSRPKSQIHEDVLRYQQEFARRRRERPQVTTTSNTDSDASDSIPRSQIREDILRRQQEIARHRHERLQSITASESVVIHNSSSPITPSTATQNTEWWNRVENIRPTEWIPTWSRRCQWCGSALLTSEPLGWCCRKGLYNSKVPLLPQFPHDLWMMLATDPSTSSQQSRRINNLFAFSSIGVSGNFVNLPAPANVAISGRIYHQIRDLSSGQHSMRWFIYDEQERSSLAARQQLSTTHINAIRRLLEQVNPFVQHLRFASSNLGTQPFALELKNPSANGEIAAVIHTDNRLHIDPRHVVVWHHGGSIARPVSILSPLYEALQYPLLFPHGTSGWHPDCGVSQIWWYRMRILREPRFHLFGRLFNEYLVDMYSRVEDERLWYIRKGREGQIEQRSNIQRQNDEIQPTNPETDYTVHDDSFILPSSFIGSRAWASEQVADSLAICRDKGNPSLFITITTNPNWPEIRSCLLPGQTATDIPDVVCRAFKARMTHAISLLQKYFGTIVYIVKVIEFQKRGLPHCHMIIKVSPEIPFNKLSSIISAEVPTEEEDKELRALVLKFNQHPKNHLDNIHSRCNRDGQCIWGFPQPIRNHNELNQFGRVQYRRRKEEDRWIAAYMPFLTRVLHCHVNVDVTSTVNIFLYLYKYLFKGPDHTLFTVSNQPIDEGEDYIRGRYLSASEAMWRIFQYEITHKSPSVISLRVHLPNRNLHQMRHRNASESAASDLLRYFARPRQPRFDTITYLDYFTTYRLLKHDRSIPLADNQWLEVYDPTFPRMRVVERIRHTKPIGRLATVSPRSGELFYCRTLLQNKPTRSFEELRTIDGQIYPTFQEAAKALGIFEDDTEPEQTLAEAVHNICSPSQLRFLFAQVIHNFPTPSVSLFERYQMELSADYLDQTQSPSQSIQLTLQSISKHLRAQGLRLSDFGLPDPYQHIDEVIIERNLYEHRQEELITRSLLNQQSFTDEQRIAFDTITRRINDPLSDMYELQPQKCFFLEGKAGRGKTYTVNTIIAYLRGRGYIVLICGSTALSVTLYEGGRTAHNLFGIPVTENNSQVESHVGRNSLRAKLLYEADFIIWEEMPMSNKTAVECADTLLRSIMRSDEPFGGKTVLGLGDFRQVAPVVKSAAITATFDASIRSSPLWNSFRILRLSAPIRNAMDPEFSTWVDSIGDGILSGSAIQLTMIARVNSLNDAIDYLFPPDILHREDLLISRAFLSPININVDDFNQAVLSRLQSHQDSVTYHSIDSVKESEASTRRFTTTSDLLEYLALLRQPGVPNSQLTLKVGAICTIMRNISPEKGLVKNTRVIVTKLAKKYVEVRHLRTSNSNTTPTFCLPRITFEFKPEFAPWTIVRRQIPLRLAYAATFNSSQGLTLDRCVLDLRTPVFAHGQLYTGISRVRNRHHIRTLYDNTNTNCTTANIVFPELLLPN